MGWVCVEIAIGFYLDGFMLHSTSLRRRFFNRVLISPNVRLVHELQRPISVPEVLDSDSMAL